MNHDPYKALYIHLPFCASRCSYCDFATRAVAPGDAAVDSYVDDLVIQIRRAGKEGRLAGIETVYLGGGTPSFIGTGNLSKLLYALSTSMHLTPEVECTMEANPESLTEAMVKDIWALGVNRLSLGVQSFDDGVLGTLGRVHTAEAAKRAVACAQTRFENVSIDLMCGIPGQDFALFDASLGQAVGLGVAHISIYPLTVEENTPFEALVEAGLLASPVEDDQAMMMVSALGALEPAGYGRYEVASYARPGYECRHNIAYWTGLPYLGMGTSAVTMTQNAARRMRVQDGRVIEELDRAQMCAEDLMLGMRMAAGIGDGQVHAASVLLPALLTTLHSLVRQGLLVHEEGRYRPTATGWLCGNELYGQIYDLA